MELVPLGELTGGRFLDGASDDAVNSSGDLFGTIKVYWVGGMLDPGLGRPRRSTVRKFYPNAVWSPARVANNIFSWGGCCW